MIYSWTSKNQGSSNQRAETKLVEVRFPAARKFTETRQSCSLEITGYLESLWVIFWEYGALMTGQDVLRVAMGINARK
jgi:hypothetical protein